MLYLPREEGQGLVEYALILVLIAVVVIVLLTIVGDEVSSTLSRIASGLNLALRYSFRFGVINMLYLPREEGQGLVEYALILVLIAVVVIVLLTLVGDEVRSTFSRIASGLNV